MSIITFHKVSKQYGDVRALKETNLTINRGEFFGLLGPNGAGKTTLIGILGHMVRRDSGTVHIDGVDLAQNPLQAKKKIGIVPQEIALDPFFNVRQTLRIQSGYFGIRKNEDRIDEILTALGLHDKAEANPRNLSGGMKRRLLIAKALVHDPEIIVLDEPTAGVDIELRNSLWEYIRILNQRGKTIILTTHYLEEAEELCDRIAILDRGEITAIDTKENLMNLVDRKILKITYRGTLPSQETVPWKLRNRGTLLGEHTAEFELKQADLNTCITTLVAQGVTILDMDISSPRLEEVFLTLVRPHTEDV
ncbi:ABC transporter ATP-binding protein [Chitinivibrio alkaliphilus]|uniref:ABC-type transport system, ATPase component n=1 Tax=Chitinivibrio alkaliphilus ACht1 TaxID=1313304 RepID=U7D7L2_9BACT|nr:ABC transporter ATP-binding protein [Chitinivibrio alkaliphilus]ERP31087.1 ABC-type transport system, ATPase component [Chitinivibrio alkaliphilus ACht1]